MAGGESVLLRQVENLVQHELPIEAQHLLHVFLAAITRMRASLRGVAFVAPDGPKSANHLDPAPVGLGNEVLETRRELGRILQPRQHVEAVDPVAGQPVQAGEHQFIGVDFIGCHVAAKVARPGVRLELQAQRLPHTPQRAHGHIGIVTDGGRLNGGLVALRAHELQERETAVDAAGGIVADNQYPALARRRVFGERDAVTFLPRG